IPNSREIPNSKLQNRVRQPIWVFGASLEFGAWNLRFRSHFAPGSELTLKATAATVPSPAQIPPLMTILELNHVAIYVTDLNRSRKFYYEVLRLEAIPRPAFDFPGAWFRLGTQQELHLIAGRDEPFSQRNPNNHFALRVVDLDDWERHLKAT